MKFIFFAFSLAVLWIDGALGLYLPQEVASHAMASQPLRKRVLPAIEDVLSGRQAREKPGPFYVALDRQVSCRRFNRKSINGLI